MNKNKERIEVKIELACADKQSYDKLKELLAALPGVESVVEEPEDDKESEAFCPKEGDICTCVIEDNIDAIFRYDGKTRTDEDGDVWLDGNLGLTWSGDLFQPYMIIHGENAEYLRDSCRLATEEEIALFSEKVKEFEAKLEEQQDWEPKKGGLFWSVKFAFYRDGMFEPIHMSAGLWDTLVCADMRKIGWVFQTESEAQSFCDKLNEAIKNVKP